MVIYLDVFFAVNFLMDLIVLLIVRKIAGEKKSTRRIVLAAVVGAAYACVILINGTNNGILEGFFTYVIISILLTTIAFGYRGVRDTLEMTLILFVVTFITSGIINTLYFRKIISDAEDLIISAFVIMGIIFALQKFVKRRTDLRAKIVNVTIVKDEVAISIKALIDTGNSLIEPISRKPVAVLTSNHAKELKKGDEKGAFVIPYKSVGMEHGILMGFVADYMEITDKMTEKGEIIKIIRPIIAEYDGRFTDTEEYQMLLHPQMIEEGEKNVCKNRYSKQNAV